MKPRVSPEGMSPGATSISAVVIQTFSIVSTRDSYSECCPASSFQCPAWYESVAPRAEGSYPRLYPNLCLLHSWQLLAYSYSRCSLEVFHLVPAFARARLWLDRQRSRRARRRLLRDRAKAGTKW